MYRGYQTIEAKPWSTTAVVALVATASLAVGVTAGVALSNNAQTLYAPVSTAVRPAVMAAPVTQMAAATEFTTEVQAPEAAAEEQYIMETVAVQPQVPDLI